MKPSVVAGMCLVALAGCKRREDPGNAALAFRRDVSHVVLPATDDPQCPNPVTVDDPDPSEPEYPLAEAYRAALQADTPQSFEHFHTQFIKQKEAKFLREQQWPRIRRHVHSYVRDPAHFSFQICRKDTKPDGRVKMFVRSFDPKKSHPPSTVVKVGDGWKLYVFSY